MSGKTLIWLGIFIGTAVGGWLGALVSGGNWFSWQSILGTALGGFLGIYAGYKLNEYI